GSERNRALISWRAQWRLRACAAARLRSRDKDQGKDQDPDRTLTAVARGRSALALLQCLVKIRHNIVNVFNTDRESDHILANASLLQFLFVQLTVSRRGRMACQGFGIANINKT